MRAVLDPNVLVAALLSPSGRPARLLLAWVRGDFELIVSATLWDELERVLAHPKLRERVPATDAAGFLRALERSATLAADPADPPAVRSSDPDDDYLIALADSDNAVLVTGDGHLLELANAIPVRGVAEFDAMLRG